MKILIITGFARSGKDTLASYIEKASVARGYKCKKLAFAKPMKQIASIMFNMTEKEIEEHKEEPVRWLDSKITPRKFLQHFGTDFVRKIVDENFWVIKMQQEINKAKKEGFDLFIITDCRFENELNLKKTNKNCLSIKVKRNNRQRISTSGHISEIGIDDDKVDIIFNNDGTLEDVKCFAKNVLSI